MWNHKLYFNNYKYMHVKKMHRYTYFFKYYIDVHRSDTREIM